jgi:Uma2 family endonuclease
MKAVMLDVPEHILEWRKRTGADQRDEVWDGVVHMPPMQNIEHQDFEGALEVYLRLRWARPRKAKVFHEVNLAAPGGWPNKNYRIPDLLLLTPERFHINQDDRFEGAPDVVVEIHSPGDESYEKLPFYAELGVPEVWIIDRDTKEPEVYLLKRGRYRKQRPTASGWVRSPATGVEMQPGRPGKLAVRMAGDDTTWEDLPED